MMGKLFGFDSAYGTCGPIKRTVFVLITKHYGRSDVNLKSRGSPILHRDILRSLMGFTVLERSVF
jgi:hypothetical protein